MAESYFVVNIKHRLVHTYTKYEYMEAHTKDMHEKEYLFPKNMIYGKSSQWTCQFRLEKSMDMPNFNLESHAMCVTYIVKLIILKIAHNICHISYQI